ncbi:MAG TPA: ABC transporter substrate-binding protein, partial [Smithellaceae bacterium]|nr:ABC transporter substrate-binding protein [Smithellaceae bacterium]
KADMFIWVAFAPDALPMLEQAKEIGFVPPVYVGSPPGWPDDFGKSPLSEGVVFYSYWHDVMKNVSKASKAYSDAFNKEYKEAPNSYFGPLCYANIMIVADAIKKAGSLEKAALIKALETTQYKSPLGDTFVFSKSNIINHQAYALPKIMQYQKGKVQVIWPWELATAKFIYPFTTTEKVAGKDEAAPDAKKAKTKGKK